MPVKGAKGQKSAKCGTRAAKSGSRGGLYQSGAVRFFRTFFNFLIKGNSVRAWCQLAFIFFILIVCSHYHPIERMHYAIQRRNMQRSENDPYFDRVNKSFESRQKNEAGPPGQDKLGEEVDMHNGPMNPQEAFAFMVNKKFPPVPGQ